MPALPCSARNFTLPPATLLRLPAVWLGRETLTPRRCCRMGKCSWLGASIPWELRLPAPNSIIKGRSASNPLPSQGLRGRHVECVAHRLTVQKRRYGKPLLQTDPPPTVANCCQNGALYGCPKNLKGFLRGIGKISKWQ